MTVLRLIVSKNKKMPTVVAVDELLRVPVRHRTGTWDSNLIIIKCISKFLFT